MPATKYRKPRPRRPKKPSRDTPLAKKRALQREHSKKRAALINGKMNYDPEIADTICRELRKGRTLTAICSDEDLPGVATIYNWAGDNVDGFFEKFSRAREIGYMVMADEMLDIADDGSRDTKIIEKWGKEIEVTDWDVVSRSKLKIDTRKWILSKMLPKVFGDRIEITESGHFVIHHRRRNAIDFSGLSASDRAIIRDILERNAPEELKLIEDLAA